MLTKEVEESLLAKITSFATLVGMGTDSHVVDRLNRVAACSTLSSAFDWVLPRLSAEVEIFVLGILIGGCGLVGLAIGSFLNVVIYRVPRKESVVSPRSRCPNCGHPIRERDNVPVVSWIVLKGRCRDCQAPISPRYPLVELACGGLFAGIAARVGFNWDLPALLVLAASLLALALIDFEHLVLPKVIVYPTFLLVAGLLTARRCHNRGVGQSCSQRLICAAFWYVVFFLMNFASPRILGFGDVRLALVLGLGLGWLGWRYVVTRILCGKSDRSVTGLWY